MLGVDHLLTAREAERGLGQMLDLGRQLGDIAGEGRPEKLSSAATVSDLGVSRDLAADCATLASLSDDEAVLFDPRAWQ